MFPLTFLLGHGEDLTCMLFSMGCDWFGDSTPLLDVAFSSSDMSFTLTLFTQM